MPVQPSRLTVTYQAARDGGCPNTTVEADGTGFVQRTGADRLVPDQADLGGVTGGPQSSRRRAEMNASWGTSTRPMFFIRFLPSFWRSSSLRLRVMSPP